ncbi:MAG: hypothetical protein IPL95_01760 [Saprospiraceae bacterium]|nr:hypothetical protein [Saprospiraceae bacterium]
MAGIMNFSYESDWRSNGEIKKMVCQITQVTVRKLYVRTANNELYIFEKN